MNEAQDNRAVDFAIVTALPVERNAVLKRLDHCERIESPSDPYVYHRGKVDIPGSKYPYELVVASFLDPGNIEAAAETTELIRRWKPQYVVMVGIAGGVAQKNVSRGDVVVANYVHYYEPGKRTEKGEERRPLHYRCDRILYSKAFNYEAAEWKGEVQVTPPSGSEGYIPRAHFGPIGSGEQVFADEKGIPRLLTECPKMLAVAMEGAGVAQAVENAGISFLEIRGISDLADSSKSDDWHEYAANAAAAFTRGFLQSKPVFSVAEQSRVLSHEKGISAPPLVIIRAQSMRPIRPDEIIPALPGDLRNRELETIGLDFTDLVASDREMKDPKAAVERLTALDGELMRALGRRGSAEFVFHGIAHIPLTILAGYLITDRQPLRLFDFFPSPGSESWVWPGDEGTFPLLQAVGLPERLLRRSGEVVIRIAVSYSILPARTRSIVARPALEIELSVPYPERSIVRSEAQVRDYGCEFRRVMDAIADRVPGCSRVHIFYAGPMSLAFHIGQQISENIHPKVTAWNYHRGYDWAVDLAAAAAGEECVIRPPDTSTKENRA